MDSFADCPAASYLLLLDVLLLNRLEVGTQVHGALVLGAQQGTHHLVRRHAHLPQCRLLKLPSQVLHLQVQLMDLDRVRITVLCAGCRMDMVAVDLRSLLGTASIFGVMLRFHNCDLRSKA